MTSPCWASDTRIGQSLLRRLAKAVVKRAGICWVTRMGGQSEGSPISTSLSASTPPVEAPISTTLPVTRPSSGRFRRRRHALVAPDAGSGRGLHLLLQLAGERGHRVDHVLRRLGDEI